MKKVSILTPCYNGAHYMERYFNSILAQTYDNIELIIVNDGSTDRTEEIILEYKQKILEKGYEFKYLKQDNKGQAAAVDEALRMFTGDYFILLDSDDFIPDSSVKKKAEFLDNNKEYGLVRTDGYLFNENDLNEPVALISRKHDSRFNENIFEDLLFENTYVANGCYMYRTDAFLSVNPQKRIYLSRGGQNWQIILPISYKYKCGFIDEPLFNCVIRENSHSRHADGNYQKIISKEHRLKDILINTLRSMDIDHDYYLKLADIKYYRREMHISLQFKDRKAAGDLYKKLKDEKALNLQDRLYFYMGINRISVNLLKVFNSINIS